MFVGHHAVGFASKRVSPHASLGLLIYRDMTEPLDRTGSIAMCLLALVLLGFYIGTAPPADTKKLAYGALTMWIVPFWAAWIDRHRAIRE